jgi:transcriptional regulator with XRE-family HTH domain
MAVEIEEHIARRLRVRRRLSGLTLQEVAERAGITFQQVQKYETGVNRVSAARLFLLARALETEAGYFFQGLE